jgi:hypothetical protein
LRTPPKLAGAAREENEQKLQMHTSHAARPAHLPWLSWLFLALLMAASMLVRAGNGMKAPSVSAAPSHSVGTPR